MQLSACHSCDFSNNINASLCLDKLFTKDVSFLKRNIMITISN